MGIIVIESRIVIYSWEGSYNSKSYIGSFHCNISLMSGYTDIHYIILYNVFMSEIFHI